MIVNTMLDYERLQGLMTQSITAACICFLQQTNLFPQ